MATSTLLSTPLHATIVAKQADFQLHPTQAPLYKFLKIAPSNKATASLGVGASSGDLFEWKLPANMVYNLARSYIEYNENAPGQANLAGPVGVYTNSFEDLFELPNSVQFGAPGGQDLVNLQWAANYTKIARKIVTPLTDMLTNSDMDGLYASNVAMSANYVPGGGSAGTTQWVGTDSFIEPKYMRQSVVGDGTTNGSVGNLNRYRQIPLSVFPGTILGVDRDFLSPTEMSLRINTNTGDKMMWANSSTTNPSTNAASILPIALSTQSSAGFGITINNCYLFLCVEMNQAINKNLFEKYAEGKMVYSVPYTTSFRLTGAGIGQQTNLQLSLSNMYGKKLKKITTTVWNPNERLNTAYDCSNVNGAKIASYQTLLNSTALQSRVLSCAQPSGLSVGMDDWLENRKFLDKRSAITSKECYQLNWFHVDQFSEPKDPSEPTPEVNLYEGLDMVAPVTWQFTGLTGLTAQPVFYVYAEFQRDLIITPGGPQYAGII